MHNKFSEFFKQYTEAKTAVASPEVPNFKKELVKQIAKIIESQDNSVKAAEVIVSRFLNNKN